MNWGVKFSLAALLVAVLWWVHLSIRPKCGPGEVVVTSSSSWPPMVCVKVGGQ